ncbi:amino acid adenylation domain-containing protein [Streptomyces sp. NPDC052236]|uniref:amino acid adenylation domain-containing protein n=1 Tax=Streptomyces sp. NPDC052236 TaxID=3365686 RepID=UPI0037D102DD
MALAGDDPAVVDGDRVVSYRELDRISGAIAQALAVRKLQPGTAVGVLGTRSWEASAAFLGILKAGGVCVPFDAHYPTARLSSMLADAGVDTVILLPGQAPVTEAEAGAAWLPFTRLLDHPTTDVQVGRPLRSAQDGAYVLFTSGTTGRSKPVLFPHRAVTRLAGDDVPWSAGADGRVLQTFGLSFDGSLFETWATLLRGGCLVVADRATMLDTAALRSLLAAQRISHAFMTTSLFHHTVRTSPDAFAQLEMVLIGGEAMDTGLARSVLAAGPPRYLINGYGPTEGGIMVSAYQTRLLAPNAVSVPIGRPVAGSSCHVLRADRTPAPPGEAGELFLGGDGLALEYLGMPEETGQAFVHLTVDGRRVRLYRSGDRARWNQDGMLEFQGRTDRQVKIRGFRVELDAVEAQLRSHPDVAEAAVHLRGNDGIGKGIAAYVTHSDPARPADPVRLRAYLATRLPTHSVPAPITVLRQFPLTANGKIDYVALRALTSSDTDDTAPQASGDDLAARMWNSVLGTTVGPDTNFFDAGGNSLLAAQVVTRTLKGLGLGPRAFSATLQKLLAQPTLAHYRTVVDGLSDGGSADGDCLMVDHEQQARVELAPVAVRQSPPSPRNARNILMTGATGFVGAFLLERLLHHSDAAVHCPVRAATVDEAADRVRENLRRHGLPLQDLDRVNAFPADLAQPDLGMDPGTLNRLARRLDLILHNGARVNFLYPYHRLHDSNVTGTRTIIDIAAPRRIPLHHVSTTAVLAGSGVGGITTVDETTPLSHPHLISMGYAETKWVAERMLQHTTADGLPVTVYRPYEIAGHSKTGVWNTTSAICAVFGAMTELGLAPDIPLPLDLVPVDHVAETIVGTALRMPHLGGVLHLTNPRPAHLTDMARRMRAAGYPLNDVPYGHWVKAMLDHVDQHPQAPIAPFAPLFATRVNGSDISIKEMYFDNVFPAIHRSRTDEVVPDWQANCPPVDDALLDHYITYLTSQGCLARRELVREGVR